MKYLIVIAALTLSGCVGLKSKLLGLDDSHWDGASVLVAGGQSNMLMGGQQDAFQTSAALAIKWAPNLPSSQKLKHEVGPAYAFGLKWVQDNPGKRLIILQCAKSGTKMETWVPGGENFEACMDFIGPYRSNVIGYVFYQGEADAVYNEPTYTKDWPAMFAQMVSGFQARVKAVPIVFAQLGHDGFPNPNVEGFKELQATVNLPGVAMITTDDLPTIGVGVHHASAANYTIGERFYRAFLNLQQGGN